MILLTGFEPFGGESTNPSWSAAQEAADRLRAEGLDAQAVRLPCVFGDAVRVLEAALEQYRPDLVVCAGQAGGRPQVSLERIAINCDDARIPDNAGNAPVDQPVVTGGRPRTSAPFRSKRCSRPCWRQGSPPRYPRPPALTSATTFSTG